MARQRWGRDSHPNIIIVVESGEFMEEKEEKREPKNEKENL